MPRALLFYGNLLYTYKKMVPEIIPAIIAKNFSELKEKIKQVEPYVKWVQLDIMDGRFVPNTTWNNPKDLAQESFKVSLEAHLMINEPEKYVKDWIDAGIKRMIFHIEAVSLEVVQEIVAICREKKVQVGVAINPETPINSFDLGRLQPNLILILGVNPGFGGQEFKPEVVEKIRDLRETNPQLTIEVDGGMNPETAKMVIDAGANAIVAGSYIFGSKDIGEAITELKTI